MDDGVRDVDGQGSGRREFLKKAGKIAFVVPAIQVLSMAPAGAQSRFGGDDVDATGVDDATDEYDLHFLDEYVLDDIEHDSTNDDDHLVDDHDHRGSMR
ncbi:MAG: hypothetical protein GXP36_04805 [Actinobacteria bacterium]|nr:hypothetical protein [Actinomycetota bacterium]